MKTQNTFADGINMDVNPLVAPKTVMSNCLNGTLITFNGNENVLLNDMGNVKIDLAYLPSGWVLVGMAEHGGIIYVAAYNPETGKSLLGSFPSPQLNFENTKEDKSNFSLTTGKYKLFKDKDLELKPGNKLAVLLDPDLYLNTEPNFNVDTTKHKRHWSILLELLTSNGALTNITEYLSNAIETVVNNDYFFISTDSTKMSDAEIHSLLENNLRIYSGTLVGVPYIDVSENLADSLEVEVYPGIETILNSIKLPIFKINCTIRSSSLLYNYDNKGLIGIEWKISAKDLNDEDYLSNGKIYFDNSLSGINGTSEFLNIDFIDIDKRDYVVNLQAIFKPDIVISLLSTSSDKLTLEIHPIFRWQDLEDELLEDLFYRQTFEALKIGTGLHLINQWRYYYTEDFVTLIWGMESYPSMDENIYDLKISFIDLNLEVIYTQFLPHEYYNGEFTELFSSNLFTSKTPYIAKIDWKVGNKPLADYRWIIPTTLYNDFYLNKLVQDFNFTEPKTSEEMEMQKLKVINGNILKFANTPIETITHTGEDSIIPFSMESLDVNSVTITNTYSYTLNPKIISTDSLNLYPFSISYNQPTKLSYIKDDIVYELSIENTLSIEHPINYNYKANISVSKLFANHNEDLIKNALCYLVIELRRKREDGLHVDDNFLGFFAYDTKTGLKIITYSGKDYHAIDNKNTNDTYEFELKWDEVSNELNYLQRRYPEQFVIPVLFTNRSSIGLNYAVKYEENWYLYWATEQWHSYTGGWSICPILNDNYYSLTSLFELNLGLDIFLGVPATVYEAKEEYKGVIIEHLLGFPFYRNTSPNGTYLEGYLIENTNDTLIEEQEVPFKFTIESNDIQLNLILNSQPYNDVILNWLTNYFNSLTIYTNVLKIRECCNTIKQALVFNGISSKVTLIYEYTHIKPGNFEIYQTINNYAINGIPTLLKYPYLGTEGITYKYIIPKEDLNGDTVYKLENENLKEFNNATIQRYKDTYYIVGTSLMYHDPDLIEAKVGNDYCFINLSNIFSFRGEEIFGTSKLTWNFY